VTHDSSPYVTAYPWSASGFGTKFADPAILPGISGGAYDVAFSSAGDAVALATTGSPPFINAYPWSASGFGTKFADPATASSSGFGIAFGAI